MLCTTTQIYFAWFFCELTQGNLPCQLQSTYKMSSMFIIISLFASNLKAHAGFCHEMIINELKVAVTTFHLRQGAGII